MRRYPLNVLCALAIVSASSTSAVAKESGSSPEVTAWVDCLQSQGARYLKSDLPLETIATAAMGNCKNEDQAVYDRMVTRSFGVRMVLGPPNVDDRRLAREAHDRMREDFRERLIGGMLEARTALAEAAP